MSDCACSGPVAIDGPAGSGKSTAARALARRLGCAYLDTGAMYRALAWEAVRRGMEPADGKSLASLLSAGVVEVRPGGDRLQVFVNGRLLESELRDESLGKLASRISALPEVRAEMVKLQRRAASGGRVVAEGRDMGTVVFPDAPHKFYLDAALAERAKRRWRDEAASGKQASLEEIAAGLAERDRDDASRPVAPLRMAQDAVLVDSTSMSAEEVVDAMLARIRGKGCDAAR